jgi:acetate---CoA ligase (ADP-forming)
MRCSEIEAGTALHEVVTREDLPLALHTMKWQTASADALRNLGIPVYSRIEGAVRGLAAATEPRPEWRVPISRQARMSSGANLQGGYWAARELLASLGVPLVEAVQVSSLQSAFSEARRIGYPVVLKNVGLEHKSESGAVVLSITSDVQLAEAWLSLDPGDVPVNFSLEAMAPLEKGIEMIVGARQHRRFGPIVLVGIGGIYAELISDVAVALAPVNEEQAMSLINSLRSSDLLAGLRGRPTVDRRAIASAVAGISRALSFASPIAEIEVNPLLATASGALGLDVLATLRRPRK